MRLSICGFGIMGERLMQAALAHPEISVTGVWDPSAAAAAKLAADYPQVPVKAAFDALLTGSDCLYVASPPNAHLEAVAAGFAAGLAVFCEKPLATDVAAAQMLVEKAALKGNRAGVNFPFASSFAVEAIEGWLSEGRIGQPQELTIRLDFAEWPRPWQKDAARWLTRRVEGGFLREVGSHYLFLTRRLLGPLLLTGAHSDFGPEDLAETSVRAEMIAGSLPVHLTGSLGRTAASEDLEWLLTGSSGQIRLRNWTLADWRPHGGDWTAAETLPIEQARPLQLRRQLDQLQLCQQGQAHRLATLAEALDVQKTVEAILVAV